MHWKILFVYFIFPMYICIHKKTQVMSTKICTKCNINLPIENFGKESRSKDGLKRRCKKCLNNYYNSIYEKNSDMKKNKSEKAKKYYVNNKKHILQLRKNKYNYLDKKNYNEKYMKENKVELNKKHLMYIKNRYTNDPVFKYRILMRKMVHRLFENVDKTEINKFLGYSATDLFNHLGDVYNKNFHVDHKIPVSWFVINTPAYIVNNLCNLHLVESNYNFKKSNKFADPVNKDFFEIAKPYIKKIKLSQITINP